jgi:hypothetical protein
MDLFVEYRDSKYIIEIKLVREKQSPEQVKAKGLEQIAKYRDSKAPDAPAYLLVFDRRPQAKETLWEDRLGWAQEGSITALRL